MKKIILSLTAISSLFLTISCSMERNMNKNMAELDKLYGTCDNPHRNLSQGEYKICKDKERAGSGSPLDADTITEMVIKNLPTNITGGSNVVLSSTNNELWQASLKTLNQYPIKIADFNGGFIETEWILDQNKQQRCSIKVQIKSPELISNGVDVNFICQNKNNEEWVNDNVSYIEESKQLTLTILQNTKSL